RAAMPKTGVPALGVQVFSVRKFPVLACSAGIARTIRKTATAAMMISTRMPEAVAARRNRRSPRERREAGRLRAGPPSRVRVCVAVSVTGLRVSRDRIDRRAHLGEQGGGQRG